LEKRSLLLLLVKHGHTSFLCQPWWQLPAAALQPERFMLPDVTLHMRGQQLHALLA
jgi:hypothetical protein